MLKKVIYGFILTSLIVQMGCKEKTYETLPEEESGVSTDSNQTTISNSALLSCDAFHDVNCNSVAPTLISANASDFTAQNATTASATCTATTDQLFVSISTVKVQYGPLGNELTFNVNRSIDLFKASKNGIAEELSIPIPAGSQIKDIVLNVSNQFATSVMHGCTQVCTKGAKLNDDMIRIHYKNDLQTSVTYNSALRLKTDIEALSSDAPAEYCSVNTIYHLLVN